MSAADYRAEMALIKSRTRRMTAVSVVLHVLLFLFFTFMPRLVPEAPALTEITWLEPGEVETALPKTLSTAEATPAPKVDLPKPPTPEPEQHLKRETPVADFTPDPQSVTAVENRISERLASLQRGQATKPIEIASLTSPSPVGRPKLAGISKDVGSPKAGTLARQGPGTPGNGPPIALNRTEPRVMKAEVVPTPAPERSVERAAPKGTGASRELAGAQMTGPVADRPIISYVSPDYPEWAKREGVEATVMIYFIVLPDGRVKENVMVQKTSGFSDFDDNALNAILAWRFQPLSGGQTGEQWGTILFNYRLSNAN